MDKIKFSIIFLSGVFLAVSVSPLLAQFIETVDDTGFVSQIKLDPVNKTTADLKYATTTFESLDISTLVKENSENTREITQRLDMIIKLLNQ